MLFLAFNQLNPANLIISEMKRFFGVGVDDSFALESEK